MLPYRATKTACVFSFLEQTNNVVLLSDLEQLFVCMLVLSLSHIHEFPVLVALNMFSSLVNLI